MKKEKIEILIVDDDPVALNIIYGLIIEWRYSATKVSSGEQAIIEASEKNYDLIIMDVKMDGMDGIKAGQVITSNKRVPILFLTSVSEKDMMKTGIKKGGFGWLIKPANPDQLKSAIISSLERGKEIKNLNTSISEKTTIGCAIGILMCRDRLNRKNATKKLKSTARNSRIKMITVAEKIISEVENS